VFRLSESRKNGSVNKALLYLKVLAEHTEGLGVRKMASITKMPPSTAHRILKELVEGGFAQSKDGLYFIGPEMYYITYLVFNQNPFYTQAMPIIKELAEQTGETVALGQYFAGVNGLTFIGTIESIHPIRHVLDIAQSEVLYAGAHGKAVLAFLPQAVQDKVLSGCVNKFTVMGVPIDPEKVRKDLAEIRSRGYAITYQETVETAYGFSSPILGPGNVVLGVVGIAIPDSRVDLSQNHIVAQKVLACAKKISHALGNRESILDNLPAQ
jgi:DNA-binding IclR family transcriptional regulator